MLIRPLQIALLCVALALPGAIAGCGGDDGDDGDDGDGGDGGEATMTETVTEPAPDEGPTEDRDGEGRAEDDDGRPEAGGQAFGGCRDLDRAGRINMAGAGTVELQRSGNELSASNVKPNEGWRSKVERDDGDEIDVTFRRGSEEVELEAEIDDGRLEVEVCRTG